MPPANPPEIPFTSAQAQQLGLSRQMLRSMLADGSIRRVIADVFVRSDVPDTVEVRAAAAVLKLPPFCVVADRSAAWLHGVDVFDYKELEILPSLEVIVLRDFSRRRRQGFVGGERDLLPTDVMSVGGVRLTTPMRTALDLGCKLQPRAALATIDQFMRLHGLTQAELFAELPRYRGRRGVIRLRQMVVLADARSESPPESWTRMAMVEAGLPVPELQHSIRVGGRELYRLDLAYPKHRVCVEYDGQAFHETPEQIAADSTRRAWLRAHGWTVIVVTADDFDQESVARWTGEVRMALSLG